MTTQSTNTLLSALLPALNIIEASEAEGVSETYTGSDGVTDVVSYKNAGAAITVVMPGPGNTNAGAPAGGWAADDTYNSIEGIEGTRFNDTIYGNAQNNIFIGGAGADTIYGGEGDDTISYATATAGVVVSLGTYVDSTGDAAGDRFQSVENVIGSAFADTINGTSGNNTIEAGGGNDKIEGFTGADYIDGGNGIDTIYYWSSITGVNVSMNLAEGETNPGNPSADAGAGDVLVNIENMVGSKWHDTLTGSNGDNVIDGYLAVGTPADILIGKGGNDTYYVVASNGGQVTQIVEEAGEGSGTDLAYTSVSYTLAANVEKLTALAGRDKAINLTGNNLANTIVGNEYGNRINGGTGADLMQGGKGNDIYYVDSTSDRVVETSTGGTTDLVSTSVSHALSSYVERLYASGSAAINLTGNTLSNVIKGNAGSNKIYGGAGNDTLYGGSGKDFFVFNTAPSSSSNKDRIMDWSATYDTIYLENAVFKKLAKTGALNKAYFATGSVAKDSNDFIGYDIKTGNLWYDSNGNASGGQVVFANLGAGKGLSSVDIYVI
ncbi:calcium-binding protein [Microvirga vignae]|uniref:calcium-binding protein n=1 Tax=Microvirga vignae TaxID=1225564 RepID=UPI00069BF823|nr:calcium-binding protein [Microvirga vignae]